jgi:dolichyl-phosphate-mannose-protein mannosyltransferase
MARMSVAAPERPPADAEAVSRVRDRLVRPMPADGWWGWLLPLAITIVAGLMRFAHLTRPTGAQLHPGGLVFDETYYAHDSWTLLHHGVELNNNDTSAGFVVHPPLGKWMIALGELALGHGRQTVVNGTTYPADTLSFRIASAIVGTLAILMLARIARRMFRSTLLGCVAGLLLTFDGLEFVQSRVAMLDIFLMFWMLAAFGCLVLDRDQGRRRLADLLDGGASVERGGPWLGLRPWRLACGVCLGAAASTKWDGIYWVPVFLALAVIWDAAARRTAGVSRPFGWALLLDGAYALVPFVVVVVAVYIASWTGWFLSDGGYAYDHDRYVHAGQSWFAHDRAVFGGWLRYQWEILNFHRGLHSGHPYLSRPYGWLLLLRPVAYFYQAPRPAACGAASCAQEVLGVGTPAIWWLSIPAFVAVFWRGISKFDWRAGAILLAFLAGYVPWFIADAGHRTMFLFYMLPVVPFMVLALTMAIGMLMGSRTAGETRRIIGTVIAGVYLVGVIANFAWLYPVLSGQVVTFDQWRERMRPIDWTCDHQPKHRDETKELAGCWI